MKNKNITKNEKDIVREICRECNWWERIIVKLLARLFVKVYNIARVRTVNVLFKK